MNELEKLNKLLYHSVFVQRWTPTVGCSAHQSNAVNSTSLFTSLTPVCLRHRVRKYLCKQKAICSFSWVEPSDSLGHWRESASGRKMVLNWQCRDESVNGLMERRNHESVKRLVCYQHIAGAQLCWLCLQHSEWITSEQDTWWRWSDAHGEKSHCCSALTQRLSANSSWTPGYVQHLDL